MRMRTFVASVALLFLAAPAAQAVTLTAAPSLVTDDSGASVSVDIFADVDVIQFDLHASWDVSYWTLTDISGAGAVERNDERGVIDDLFGDVGTDDPISAGSPLFTLTFDVTGSPSPGRTVLEVGNLTNFDDPVFDPARTVLLADPDFNILVPSADRSENGLVLTPEPSTATLFLFGVVGLAVFRARS